MVVFPAPHWQVTSPLLPANACRAGNVEVCSWRCWIGLNVRRSDSTGKVSGAWVFKTTRVPVRALFENLEDGATVNDFLTWFPGVTREQIEAVLEHAERSPAVA